MAGWLEVATVAFVAQLTVLPGEKVQFIIAGLSTRFSPLLVVSAAGAAFAGWTVLEIVFGRLLQRVVPAVYLDVGTGVLFLLFAVALFESAPSPETAPHEIRTATTADDESGAATASDEQSRVERVGLTDGGELDVRVPVVGWQVPNALGGALPIFALLALGEFGDKTQLVTIGLAAQYAQGTAIWAGEMAAIVPVSLANALFFHRFSHRFNARTAHFAGAALFALFGLDTVQATVTGVAAWELLVEAVAGSAGALLVA